MVSWWQLVMNDYFLYVCVGILFFYVYLQQKECGGQMFHWVVGGL